MLSTTYLHVCVPIKKYRAIVKLDC